MATLLHHWPVWIRAVFDSRTPTLAKVFMGVGLLYGLSPLDIVPDLIPLLGQLDDLGIIFAVVLYFLNASRGVRKDLAKDKDVIDVEAVK